MTYCRLRSIVLLCVLLALMAVPDSVRGETARDLYFKADACYKSLRNNPARHKYRSYWLKCIEQYNAVYLKDPDGPWAAAGLFMAARLHRELFHHSYRVADNTAAEVLLRKIIQQYPQSRYREKARKELAAARKDAPASAAAPQQKRKADKPPKSGAGDKKADNKAGRLYAEAGKCTQHLRKNPRLQKYRDRWFRCIDAYDAAVKASPEGVWAAAGMFRQAELYLDLSRRSYLNEDRQAGIALLREVVDRFPDSRYHPQSIAKLEKLDVPIQLSSAKPEATQPTEAEETGKPDAVAQMINTEKKRTESATVAAAAAPGDQVTVSGLRFWSNPSYTRIVIDASGETVFRHHLLKEDPKIHKPKRLFVDLADSRLANGVNRVVPINDNLLSNARAGQFTHSIVRVVVDIKSIRTYKIFSLKNPFRIVIDLWGKNDPATARKARTTATSVPVPGPGKAKPGSIARQLALGVSRVVIDPGHGGKDPGALGCKKGVREKTVTLQISKLLAKKIKSRLGCEVILTRSKDRFLSLEERTAIANTKNADIFISIHVNSHRNRNAYGIETYFLNLATDDDAIRVAAIENATSKKNISDLQSILNDLMQNAKINESSRLATRVQDGIYRKLRKSYSKIRSKGVKQAPFYVLLGAQMPAILVETSFLSNPRECNRLTNQHYQSLLCDGIVNGLERYIQETSPTALLKKRSGGKG
jgi:N-acetylmuramoyl-L-alanine amidase